MIKYNVLELPLRPGIGVQVKDEFHEHQLDSM